MARPMQPSRTVTTSQPNVARVAYSTDVDLSVAWSAKLVQPDTMAADSSQPAVVQVAGPQMLRGPAWVRVNGRRYDGAWVGDEGQRRTLVATLDGVARGVHTVEAVIGATVLRAGLVRVR